MEFNIFLTGVLVSIALYLVVGLYAGKRVAGVDDYYVSGRNQPTLLIAGTLFASMLSVSGFTGDQGFCYGGNITTIVLLNAMCAIGYVIGPLIFGRYLRRSGCSTMPEYFGMRFNDFRNRRAAAIITVISLTAYLLASITGVGILMQALTGFKFKTCLFLAWFCFTFFTFVSGSNGVVLTDTMMFLVFLFSTLIAGPYIFRAQGGLSHLLENLMNNPDVPEGLLDYHGNIAGTGASNIFGAMMYAVTMGFVWMITVSVSPWQAGRNLMAKNEHVTFRAGCIASICTVVFLTYLYLQSISVINIKPDIEDPQTVLIWASFNAVPKLIGTFILAGIMAAGLSSASTFLSVVGFSLTADIIPHSFKSEKSQLRASRIVMLVYGLVSLALAYMGLGSVRIISWFASAIIAASWAVPGIGSVVSKKLSATGARWSMIAGFVSYIGIKIMLDCGIGTRVFINFLDPFFIGLACSLLFAVIGSRYRPVTETELKYREKLMLLPKEEAVHRDYRIDIRYSNILIISGVLVTLFLLFGWALPYNGWI